MFDAIMARTTDFSEQMLLHYAAPNRQLVVEVMQLDAAQLCNLSDERISTYILVLGQYIVMLQHNENLKNIEYMLRAKALEHEINKARFAEGGAQGKTEKEKRARLFNENPALCQMDFELTSVDAERMLVAGMVKAVDGLLLALKKEKTGRRPE